MLKRIYYTLLSILRNISTSIAHKKFLKGKRKRYRYGDEIFCTTKEELKLIEKEYTNIDFWKAQQNYTLSTIFPVRFLNQYKMIFEDFLPRINYKESEIIDIGCAAGEWTIKLSPYCKHIDGFEYSDNMCKTAINMWKDKKNVSFYQSDARSINYQKKYDAAMLLGILMYMEDFEDIYMILKNLHDNIKDNGLVVTKDTLNAEDKDVVYLFNRMNGYKGNYWSQEIYYKQFERAGFKIEKEILLEDVYGKNMHFISRGCIWKKI